jgi:hypothetical protein
MRSWSCQKEACLLCFGRIVGYPEVIQIASWDWYGKSTSGSNRSVATRAFSGLSPQTLGDLFVGLLWWQSNSLEVHFLRRLNFMLADHVDLSTIPTEKIASAGFASTSENRALIGRVGRRLGLRMSVR